MAKKKIEWKKSKLDYDKLNQVTPRAIAMSQNQKLGDVKANGKIGGDANVREGRGIFKDPEFFTQNAKDQWIKNAKAKKVLNFELAEEIRERKAKGETSKDLQKEYGVSKSTIQRIIARTRYNSPEED